MTPLYKLSEGDNKIYIKRDDLIPFSFGGNKARKAFNFFKEIDAGAYNAVVTYGSGSSNHCRIVSNMAKARNLSCYIISPKEASESTYNSKMMELFGAEITTVPVSDVSGTIDKKMAELKSIGMKPYFIPGGGHGNLGTQAYVDCYEEIRKYEMDEDVVFDCIFFASGTGTTHAGLVCGKLLNEDNVKIIGISIARKNPRGKEVVLDSIKAYLSLRGVKISEDDILNATVFIDDYIGEGYGSKNGKVSDTIEYMMKKHGIPMDSTYTAKAYTGMLDYIDKNKITKKNILFIHTGGTPLFFDDLKGMN